MRANVDELPALVRLASDEGSRASRYSSYATTSAKKACRHSTSRCAPSSTANRCARKPRNDGDDLRRSARRSASGWASPCVFPGSRRVTTLPTCRAGSAATGPGAALTSATTAAPCLAAWSPHPTASTSAAWRRKASRRYGTAPRYSAFGPRCHRPRRRPCAAAVPFITAHSERLVPGLAQQHA